MENKEFVDVVFRAGGIKDVQQAYESVDQVLAKLERASVYREQRAQKARTEAVKQGGRERTKAETSLFNALDKLHGDSEKERVDRARSGAKETLQIEKRLQEDMLRLIKRSSEDQTRKLEEEIKKREAREKEAHDKALRRRKEWASTVFGAGGGAVRSLASQAMHYGAMGLTIGGAVSVGHAAHRAMSAEHAAIGLAHSMFLGSSGNSKDQVEQRAWLAKNGHHGKFDPNKLMGFAGRAQAEAGFDKAELASAWQGYVNTSSDWKSFVTPEGQKSLIQMAKLAKGTGTDLGEMMSAAGSIKAQNPNIDNDGMLEMMLGIVGQGKLGAVSMSEIAKSASTITAGAGAYKGDLTVSQKRMLGLSQLAIQTSGSSAEAATTVARFTSDTQTKAKDMEKNFSGLKGKIIADKKTGALNDPAEILAAMFDVTGGNMSKFGTGKGNLGLGVQSVRLTQALSPKYQEAVEAAKAKGLDSKAAHQAGVERVRSEVRKFSEAGYSRDDIFGKGGQFDEFMEAKEERFEKVKRNLLDKLETALLPVLERLAHALESGEPEIAKFIDGMSKLAAWVIENPWKGLGALVGAKITAEIASAAIGKATSSAVESMISRVAGGATAGGAPGGGGMGLGPAGAIAAVTALSVDGLYVTTMEIMEGKAAGREAGEQAAADMQSGDAGRVAAAGAVIGDAAGKAGTLDVANAYMTKFNEYAQWAYMPMVAATNRAIGAGAESHLGVQSNEKRALETLKAKDLIDTYDLKMKISQSVADGVRTGVANADHPSRNGPMTKR
ncbi:MAG: hypothetical protein KF764_25455 [Labilithrix sp.]|nr:hypothetical protein [Labilithrix sp.]